MIFTSIIIFIGITNAVPEYFRAAPKMELYRSSSPQPYDSTPIQNIIAKTAGPSFSSASSLYNTKQHIKALEKKYNSGQLTESDLMLLHDYQRELGAQVDSRDPVKYGSGLAAGLVGGLVVGHPLLGAGVSWAAMEGFRNYKKAQRQSALDTITKIQNNIEIGRVDLRDNYQRFFDSVRKGLQNFFLGGKAYGRLYRATQLALAEMNTNQGEYKGRLTPLQLQVFIQTVNQNLEQVQGQTSPNGAKYASFAAGGAVAGSFLVGGPVLGAIAGVTGVEGRNLVQKNTASKVLPRVGHIIEANRDQLNDNLNS